MLDDYAQYQTLTTDKDSNFPRAEAVKEICAATRAQGDKTLAGTLTDINARLEAALNGAKFNEMKSLGVLAEDANACYSGLVEKVRTELGTEKTQVAVSADTIVRGKLVFYHLYTVYHDWGTMTAALARHKRNVAALLKANGNEQLRRT